MPDGSGGTRLEVSVILPAFNEVRSVDHVAREVHRVLSQSDFTWEIVVVDDGSTDGSRALMRSLGGLPGVRIVTHEENLGYGAAIKTGIGVVRHPYVAIMDTDGTYTADSLRKILEETAGWDMVVGEREGVKEWKPNVHALGRRGLLALARIFLGAKIPDLNSGLRVMRREVIERWKNDLPDGFSATTTLTMNAHLNGLAVKYVSIEYHKRRGRSKVRPVRDGLRALRTILRIGLAHRAAGETWAQAPREG